MRCKVSATWLSKITSSPLWEAHLAPSAQSCSSSRASLCSPSSELWPRETLSVACLELLLYWLSNGSANVILAYSSCLQVAVVRWRQYWLHSGHCLHPLCYTLQAPKTTVQKDVLLTHSDIDSPSVSAIKLFLEREAPSEPAVLHWVTPFWC